MAGRIPVLFLAIAGVFALTGCSAGAAASSRVKAAAQKLTERKIGPAVTTTAVPAWGCGYNVNRDLVCDDGGDGYADRYGDRVMDAGNVSGNFGTSYGATRPAPRVNERGETMVFDAACNCWVRAPDAAD
ncbi:MAG: hypothetical protein R3C13_07175 [Hyphomonas sp.]|uniref:hypothetical protein n=1 Tax=Hyphomonas sp. TaxID=87 RepID=UPI003529CC91